jgi:hypothetical protein
MAEAFDFPVSPAPQLMQITLGTREYSIRFAWCDSDEGGWFMDVSDSSDVVLFQGIPLTAGQDILGQLAYLGIEGSIIVATDDDQLVEPTFTNFGINGRVLFLT